MSEIDEIAERHVAPLMPALLAAVYWFDDALQSAFEASGRRRLSRRASFVLMNLGAGVDRPAQLARNTGVSHQAMGQTLDEMVAQDLIVVEADPCDKRARIVRASPKAAAIIEQAVTLLHGMENALAQRIGRRKASALRAALMVDWGASPIVPPHGDAPPKHRGRPRNVK